MPWECAECNAGEGRETRIDAVCHHCGKPLCRGDRVELADYAFAGSTGEISQVAVHCRPCRDEYHRLDLSVAEDIR
jgi:hypothetical protein